MIKRRTKKKIENTTTLTSLAVNYALPTEAEPKEKGILLRAWRNMAPLMMSETGNLTIAVIAIIFNSISTLFAPIVIAHAVDSYIATGQFNGVVLSSLLLLVLYLIALVAGFYQTRRMGRVGRNILFKTAQ